MWFGSGYILFHKLIGFLLTPKNPPMWGNRKTVLTGPWIPRCMHSSFQLLDSRILVSGTLILDSTSKNSSDPVFLTGDSKTRGRGLSFFKKSVVLGLGLGLTLTPTLTLKQHSALTKDRPRPTRNQFLPKVLITFQTNFMGILVYMSRADIYTNFFHFFFHSVLTPSNFLVQSVLIVFPQTLRFSV